MIVEVHATGVDMLFDTPPEAVAATDHGNLKSGDANPGAIFKFYRCQAAHGRSIMFPAEVDDIVSSWPDLVASPQGVVYSESKPAPDGRPIVHLSFPDGGVNAETAGKGFTLDPLGFATLSSVASAVVAMLTRAFTCPELFPPDVLRKLILTFIVDGDCAFMRLFLSLLSVGKISSRVERRWIVALSCWFGWEGSSRYFSGFTRAIGSLHRSGAPASPATGGAARFHSVGHVDDAVGFEFDVGTRVSESVERLVWSTRVLLGFDGVSMKKHLTAGFPAVVHKALGAWIHPDGGAVCWPASALRKIIDLLGVAAFQRPVVSFVGQLCQSLCGLCQWPGAALRLLPLAGLYALAAKVPVGQRGDCMVFPRRLPGESTSQAAEKIHFDLDVIRAVVLAVIAHPPAGVVSMVSLLDPWERLSVPGEAARVSYCFSDACGLGLSYGVEAALPGGALARFITFVAWPPTVRAIFERVTAGDVSALEADVSTPMLFMGVLECMGPIATQTHHAALIARSLHIIFIDSQNAEGWLRKGYARNAAARHLVLRHRAKCMLDEVQPLVFYVNTVINGFPADITSREDWGVFEELNSTLDVPFVRVPPSAEVLALIDWLPSALVCPAPGVSALIEGLSSFKLSAPPAPFLRHPEGAPGPGRALWQLRASAADSPLLTHPLGLLAPDDVLAAAVPLVAGRAPLSFADLSACSRGSTGRSSVSDLWCTSAVASMAALAAGCSVVQGLGPLPSSPPALPFEALVGLRSLGSPGALDLSRLAYSDIAIVDACCSDALYPVPEDVVVRLLRAPALAQAARSSALVCFGPAELPLLARGSVLATLFAALARHGFDAVEYRVLPMVAWGSSFASRLFAVVAFARAGQHGGVFEWPSPPLADLQWTTPLGLHVASSVRVAPGLWLPACGSRARFGRQAQSAPLGRRRGSSASWTFRRVLHSLSPTLPARALRRLSMASLFSLCACGRSAPFALRGSDGPRALPRSSGGRPSESAASGLELSPWPRRCRVRGSLTGIQWRRPAARLQSSRQRQWRAMLRCSLRWFRAWLLRQ
jgi:hypothetical protein